MRCNRSHGRDLVAGMNATALDSTSQQVNYERVTLNRVAGIGVPNYTGAIRAHRPMPRRVFCVRASDGQRSHASSMAGGAGGLSSPPALCPVRQSCVVRHPAIGVAVADSTHTGVHNMRTTTAVPATVRSFLIARVPAIAPREDLDCYLSTTPDLIEAGQVDDSAALYGDAPMPSRRRLLVDRYDRPADRPNSPHAMIETIARFVLWSASRRARPRHTEIAERYGVSRATAYRWLRALRAATGDAS